MPRRLSADSEPNRSIRRSPPTLNPGLCGFKDEAALSRAWTRGGATHELWDGGDWHLVATGRSGDVSENPFVRVVPVDAASTATVRADGIGLARRDRWQRGAPVRF
jgi:hypothetical protein